MGIKHKIYIILLLMLILSSFLAACEYQGSVVPVPSKPPSQSENHPAGSSVIQEFPITTDKNSGEWNTVLSFSGIGDETSPDFYIASKEWRLTWMIETELPQHCTFNIFIYNKEKSTIPFETVSVSADKLTDTVNFHEGESSYYLQIIAANLKSWAVIVEDRGSEDEAPPVQIVEIHYQGTVFEPAPEDCLCYERIEPDEYVVVKNMSTEWVDVRDWKIINISREGKHRFVFPDYFTCCPDFFKDYFGSNFNCVPPMPCILAPHQSVLVYTDEYHPETGGLSFNYGRGDIWENDRPNIAVLYNAEGEEVGRCSYLIPSREILPPLIQITHINYTGELNLLATDNMSEAAVETDEYVEITNLSDQHQVMGGWVLKNITKGSPVFIFPDNFTLGPEDKVLIYTRKVHTPGDFSFYYSSGDIWNDKEPDTAVLYNSMGEEVNRRSYEIMN